MSSDHHRVIVESTPQQTPRPAPESRRGSLLGWALSIILVLVLVVRFLPEALMLWGLWTPPTLVEVTVTAAPARPAVTVRAIPVEQPAAPVQPTAPTPQPAVQADPAAPLPAPAPVEYVPPAEPIVQPTADPWYAGTIKGYADRDPCSMPRANPQTCAGEVPELPWPNGRP